MAENYSNYPTLKQAQESIARLNQIQWPKYNETLTTDNFIETVQKIIFEEFEFLPNLLRIFKPKQFPLPFFRVRPMDTFTNIDLFTEHSYPPINIVNFGRCNFPKSPVFYCSNNSLVSLLEVVRENEYKKKNFCISSWELIDNEDDFVFQSFMHTEVDEGNSFSLLKKAEIEKINEPFENSLSEDQQLGFLEFIKFLHDSFINDKIYSLSATLAHRTLFFKHQLSTDILMYPSIQTRFKGVNMAINPNFVSSSMKLKRLYIVDLDEIDLTAGKFQMNIKKYATANRNGFDWKNVEPDSEDYKNLVLKDFGLVIEDKMKFKFTPKKNEKFD